MCHWNEAGVELCILLVFNVVQNRCLNGDGFIGRVSRKKRLLNGLYQFFRFLCVGFIQKWQGLFQKVKGFDQIITIFGSCLCIVIVASLRVLYCQLIGHVCVGFTVFQGFPEIGQQVNIPRVGHVGGKRLREHQRETVKRELYPDFLVT